MLLTDAYGGHGGIALANRDAIEAMCLNPAIEQVVALPRIAKLPLSGSLPDKLDFDLSAIGGMRSYLRAMARALRRGPFDMVFCGHINLLPLARAVATLLRAPLSLTIHGIEAWKPSERAITRWTSGSADFITAVSGVTLERFRSWAPYPDAKCAVLPNAIHFDRFSVGPKNAELERRYDVEGRRVVMTFGRLAGQHRYKGFDRMLEALGDMIELVPDLVYIIAGDGADRQRLERKALTLGVAKHVRFTGMVAEHEKADHFRLADVYAMPSRGEGFGFVLLEAMACGTPSIGSTEDGTREAMREGLLGPIVDPLDTSALVDAVVSSLERPRAIPPGLDYFAFPNFVTRLNTITGEVMARAA
ncbi:glycosyltransferase family 4 protein [Sphingomonas bacterium]|uniref:glycosyltransferase family 4 protein n=1 Tax=Sphingomonas bacterium TaxID=1895847 RepID=UPI00260527C4|nr:glycosyltransferase family 4 protein [Sphingomonas bacterium]MDB5679114.1 glycosyltransferase family 1 protein [Sphingomonas bacterium]